MDLLIGKDKGEKDILLTSEDKMLNTMVLGRSYDENKSCIKNMLFQDMKNRDEAIIIITSQNENEGYYGFLAKHNERRMSLFDMNKPSNNLYFNLLNGDNSEASNKINYLFEIIEENISNKDKIINRKLLENAIRVVKEVYKERATLNHIYDLVTKKSKNSIEILNRFKEIINKCKITSYNKILQYFEVYFSECDSLYYDCSQARAFLENILISSELREYLLPSKNKVQVDFDVILDEGDIFYCVLSKTNKYLNIILLLQYNSCITKRATENIKGNVYLENIPAVYNCIVGTILRNNIMVNISTIIFLKELEIDDEHIKFLLSNIGNFIINSSISLREFHFLFDEELEKVMDEYKIKRLVDVEDILNLKDDEMLYLSQYKNLCPIKYTMIDLKELVKNDVINIYENCGELAVKKVECLFDKKVAKITKEIISIMLNDVIENLNF